MKKIVVFDDDPKRLEEASKLLGKEVKPGKELWVEEEKAKALKTVLGEEAILEDMNEG